MCPILHRSLKVDNYTSTRRISAGTISHQSRKFSWSTLLAGTPTYVTTGRPIVMTFGTCWSRLVARAQICGLTQTTSIFGKCKQFKLGCRKIAACFSTMTQPELNLAELEANLRTNLRPRAGDLIVFNVMSDGKVVALSNGELESQLYHGEP